MSRLRYEDFVRQIDVDAFELAIGFEPLTQDRGNDIGHCVFPANHKNGDSTGKFAIERDDRLYNCFVCGGGTLLQLVQILHGLDTTKATEYLYQFAHGERLDDDEFADDLVAQLFDDGEEKHSMPVFTTHSLERFTGPTDYFLTRGISEEVIHRYGLRYSDHVTKRDYEGPASIWPHHWMGKLVGWQYRWHDYPDIPFGKWTNTMDFPKATTLFNYDEALRATEPVIICESQGTVLFLASYGIPAVAYFGAKPTEVQLKLMRRFGQGVILAPDNDLNGDTLIDVATSYLERFIPVSITGFVDGEGADLGDYAHADDPERAVREHLKYRIWDADLLDF
jgi:hypothetical protein